MKGPQLLRPYSLKHLVACQVVKCSLEVKDVSSNFGGPFAHAHVESLPKCSPKPNRQTVPMPRGKDGFFFADGSEAFASGRGFRAEATH